MALDHDMEWLESDGRGGFASGTASGVRTRRYHALLLRATQPPAGRVVLVNGVDALVETSAGEVALSTQRYAPDVYHPDGVTRLLSFTHEPWPTWTYRLPNGSEIRQELLVQRRTAFTIICWTLVHGSADTVLRVRPFLSGRDYHALHHENDSFQFDADVKGSLVAFAPYPGIPTVAFATNGDYRHAPEWYRQFRYGAEEERGLDDTEDLASPGEWRWRVTPGSRACMVIGTSGAGEECLASNDASIVADTAISEERARRAAFPSSLDLAADAYLVQRKTGRTILAGYPWFTDWGRDTFIAVRGLCFATGRFADARDILLEWAGTVSEGMLPNRFSDSASNSGEQLEYNAVDASLWYVIAVHEFLERANDTPGLLTTTGRAILDEAVDAIVDGYMKGTRFGIRMDDDGLLAAGTAGVQLTWMDAKVGDRVITPRHGKPVEVQALWLNVLKSVGSRRPALRRVFKRGLASFEALFWNESDGFLADVVDVDGQPGTRDDTFRPNQILAIGGLPVPIVTGERARRVVDAVESRLLTPLGLRSLAPGYAGYRGRYTGGPAERDSAYHQGPVWPWLMGPFVDAWLRVHGNTEANRTLARQRFLQPLRNHLETAGLGHVSEIADGDAPHTPRGCPFQAWSLGELIRLDRQVLSRVTRSRKPQVVALS
jgi:predicted glycogen debranching enzyme